MLNAEDVYLFVYGRLVSGEWTILIGKTEATSLIEDTIYPPEAPDNAGFEVIYKHRKYFFLAKKTNKLRSLLKLEHDDDDMRSSSNENGAKNENESPDFKV